MKVEQPGVTAFTELTDVPNTYVGSANEHLAVNATADGVDFVAAGGGSGTVTDVSVVTANGVSGSVATSTTTPAITLTLGAITPSSVAAVGTVTGSNLSGTNTGDNATNTQYSGLAASKQDTLVSGTNIKTVNGNTLLGSGDVVISSSAAWGGITGTLSSQTDLQTALDGKVDENTAIAGATNTKITYDAKGLVTAGSAATTADIADSLNKRYVTDANLTVIGNTSGTNTGDQTSIVGITGTKAQFDTAVSDGNIVYTDAIGVTVQGYSAVLANTTASFVTADETKLDWITVTQAVNLDTIESDTATNNAKVTNATHTGDATGATALTVVKIQGKDFPTLSAADDNKYPKYVSASNAFVMTALAGGGNVSNTGTPANNQVAVWTDATTIEGDSAFTFDTTTDALSIGTGGVFTTGTIELGAASDTTLSRSAAGVLAVEGVPVIKATSGVGATPTASGTTAITHGLGRTPTIIRIYSGGGFTSNAAATPTTYSMGIYTSSGNACIYQGINGTTTIAAASSTAFAIYMITSAGNLITGVIQNVGATTFDIVWTETGTQTRGVYMWEAQ
jgi:hypothetical protein